MSSFAGPSYLTIRSSVYIILIWDPYIFNLYNLWQTRWCIYIRRKPRQCGLHFHEQITITRFLLLQPSIRPVPAQVILLSKGPPKLCIECHLVPLWAFPPKSPGSRIVRNDKIWHQGYWIIRTKLWNRVHYFKTLCINFVIATSRHSIATPDTPSMKPMIKKLCGNRLYTITLKMADQGGLTFV